MVKRAYIKSLDKKRPVTKKMMPEPFVISLNCHHDDRMTKMKGAKTDAFDALTQIIINVMKMSRTRTTMMNPTKRAACSPVCRAHHVNCQPELPNTFLEQLPLN